MGWTPGDADGMRRLGVEMGMDMGRGRFPQRGRHGWNTSRMVEGKIKGHPT